MTLAEFAAGALYKELTALVPADQLTTLNVRVSPFNAEDLIVALNNEAIILRGYRLSYTSDTDTWQALAKGALEDFRARFVPRLELTYRDALREFCSLLRTVYDPKDFPLYSTPAHDAAALLTHLKETLANVRPSPRKDPDPSPSR